MTRKEQLIALAERCNGGKVTRKSWYEGQYIWFDGPNAALVVHDGALLQPSALIRYDDWQPYEEPLEPGWYAAT